MSISRATKRNRSGSTAGIFTALNCRRLDSDFQKRSPDEKRALKEQVGDLTRAGLMIAQVNLQTTRNQLQSADNMLASLQVILDKVKTPEAKNMILNLISNVKKELPQQLDRQAKAEAKLDQIAQTRNAIKLIDLNREQEQSIIQTVAAIRSEQEQLLPIATKIRADVQLIADSVRHNMDPVAAKQIGELTIPSTPNRLMGG